MENADAFFETCLADGDELVGRALEPRRHHNPIVMPDLTEVIPQARVAVDHPIFDEIPKSQFVGGHLIQG